MSPYSSKRQRYKYQFYLMGCTPVFEFRAYFTAKLHSLSDDYLQIIKYIKSEQLFGMRTPELQALVELYLANPKTFNKYNLQLCAVDATHKLHPLDYETEKVNKEWLINACLRQQKFADQFPYDKLTFDLSYKNYVEFLYTCKKNPTRIIVPNKLADFMWHAHMQDNFTYKEDCKAMLNMVLDHFDDIPDAELDEHAKYTEDFREKAFKMPLGLNPENLTNGKPYQFPFIDYGPEFSPPPPPPPTSTSKDDCCARRPGGPYDRNYDGGRGGCGGGGGGGGCSGCGGGGCSGCGGGGCGGGCGGG